MSGESLDPGLPARKLTLALDLFDAATEDFRVAWKALRERRSEKLTDLSRSIELMNGALALMIKEAGRLEKFRTPERGGPGGPDAGIDLADARAEILERLARVRRAG